MTRSLALFLAAVGSAAGQTPLAEEQLFKLAQVQIIYVDPLHGEGGQQIRDMLIGSLQRLSLFILTEDAGKADAFLRGSAEDLIYNDYYREREGINARGSVSRSERSSGESDFGSASFGLGDTEATSRRERKHETSAAVRLVLRTGEVIWSVTKESRGAKYRGSSSDVADQVAKELRKAYELGRRLAAREDSVEGLGPTPSPGLGVLPVSRRYAPSE